MFVCFFRVIKTLPEANIVLLKYLIVLLYHISVNTERNKMDSSSLAVCVSPNLLQCDMLTDTKMLKNVSYVLLRHSVIYIYSLYIRNIK